MTDTAAALRVLVADDDAEARELLVSTLESLGHEVVAQVGNGREASELATVHKPDVVLLDVHMPGGSGIDAAKEVAATHPGIAVVLFTGDETLSLSEQDVRETAAISMLAKPARKGQLDSALRLAVANARKLTDARDAASDARRQLEERKTIERAKGLLMKRTRCSEQEAYRILQRSSQDRSVPMVQVALETLRAEPGYTPSPPRE
jgi:two-component system, response regulator PdtaR